MFRCIAAAILWLIPTLCGAEEQVLVCDAPAWVLPPVEEIPEAEEGDGGIRHHLSDFQHHLEEDIRYERYVIRILNESGVEDFSQLSFDFQPEHESLQLHEITIERDGRQLDRLTDARIETLRREEDMEARLYNGELTALIILDDVRPGDLLSYSFSRVGGNPVHAGHHHRFRQLGYSSRVDHVRRRLLWDKNQRDLRWQTTGPEVSKPRRTSRDGLAELVWEARDLEPIRPESNTPGWIDDYPWLEYSDYESWGAYVEHARGILDTDETLPESMIELCEEIRSTEAEPARQVTAVLNWVKRNVRYLGSFFGEHTHRPYPLDEICRRRFGDCKDKGTLTIAMLRHLGFDAAPALVHTSQGPALDRYLPGHSAFNHLVVHLRFEDEDFLLDPTHTFQRGPLQDLSTRDYGHACIIREGRTELLEIEPRGIDADSTNIRETFTVPSMTGGARLDVHTVATGGDANSLRRDFATSSHDEIALSYEEFYAGNFPGTTSTAEIEFEDDPEANRIVIRESYDIPEFWTRSEESGSLSAWVSADYLLSRLLFPEAEERRHPYAISHPLRIRQIIEVKLPEPWDITESEVEISHPAFDYSYSLKELSRGARIEADYRSRATSVKAADFERFVEDMSRVQENYSLELYDHRNRKPAAEGVPQTGSLGAMIVGSGTALGLLVGLLLAVGLWFWDPPSRATGTISPYVGLGGWLVLPMIGIILSPIALLVANFSYFELLEDMNAVLEGETGIGEWRGYYFLGSSTTALLIPLSILQIVLLFQRRTSFPWFFIGFALLSLITDICVIGIESGIEDLKQDDTRATSIGRQTIALLIWGSYMLKSQRVRATFVRLRAGAAPPPLPSSPEPAPAP